MRIGTLPAGDPIHRYEKCIVVPFAGKRRVLSTCAWNGGYREDLTAVFNNDINPGAGMECRLCAPTYEEHLARTAEALGLDPETAAGMSTAASMENVALAAESWGDTQVMAAVTGGIEVNGARAGDPASWDETAAPPAGTINILLAVNVDLTPGAMARALGLCGEAKAAALQELQAPSRFSSGIATGSGTDGTVVVCNAEAPVRLTDAGQHSKLGELVGKAVKQAVKEALRLQTGLSPESQRHGLRRLERWGITEQSLWERYRETRDAQDPPLSRAEFSEGLDAFCREGQVEAALSLYAHLRDQREWGLLEAADALWAGERLMEWLKEPGGSEIYQDLLRFAALIPLGTDGRIREANRRNLTE